MPWPGRNSEEISTKQKLQNNDGTVITAEILAEPTTANKAPNPSPGSHTRGHINPKFQTI